MCYYLNVQFQGQRVNDLPNAMISTNMSDNHKKILIVDDRSVIVNNPYFTDFEKVIYMSFKYANKRSSSNLLPQNSGKTHAIYN
jgi:hypothetical protein